MHTAIFLSTITTILTVLVWKFSRARNRTCNLLALAAAYFVALFAAGCTPGPAEMVNELSVTIAGLIPIAASVLAVLFPGQLAAFEAAAGLVTTALTVLEKLIKDYQGAPSQSGLDKVAAGFADVQQNLSALMNACKIEDSKTQAKVTAVVTAAQQSLALLEANLFGHHPQVAQETKAQ